MSEYESVYLEEYINSVEKTILNWRTIAEEREKMLLEYGVIVKDLKVIIEELNTQLDTATDNSNKVTLELIRIKQFIEGETK